MQVIHWSYQRIFYRITMVSCDIISPARREAG